jgi:hypothetical protein
MIIKCTYTTDVFQKNSCLFFGESRSDGFVKPEPQIGALCIACQEPGLPRDMEILYSTCFENSKTVWEDVRPPLSAFNPWIFISDSGWRHADRVSRYKRIWRKLSERWDLSGFSNSIELEVNSSEGIRFTGLAQLSPDAVGTAFQLMREYPAVIVLFPFNGPSGKLSWSLRSRFRFLQTRENQ